MNPVDFLEEVEKCANKLKNQAENIEPTDVRFFVLPRLLEEIDFFQLWNQSIPIGMHNRQNHQKLLRLI